MIGALRNLRVVSTYLGAHSIPANSGVKTYVDEIVNSTLPKIAQKKLAHRVDVFIEKGYFSKAHAKKIFQKAKTLGLAFTAHADQLNPTGAGVFAAKMGAQSVDHLVQVSVDEIKTLAHSNVVCNFLPTSDFYLKMDYPPARKFIDAGAICGLATDFNPGSSPSYDLSLVGVLARLEMKMSLPEVLVAYTINSARALGLNSLVGSLEKEKSCDFSVLEDSWRELFYSVGFHPVVETWVQAKRRYKF